MTYNGVFSVSQQSDQKIDFPLKKLNTYCKIRSYIQAFIKRLKVDVVLFLNRRCSFWTHTRMITVEIFPLRLTRCSRNCNFYYWKLYSKSDCFQAKTWEWLFCQLFVFRIMFPPSAFGIQWWFCSVHKTSAGAVLKGSLWPLSLWHQVKMSGFSWNVFTIRLL